MLPRIFEGSFLRLLDILVPEALYLRAVGPVESFRDQDLDEAEKRAFKDAREHRPKDPL